jgi:hypothetical protein
MDNILKLMFSFIVNLVIEFCDFMGVYVLYGTGETVPPVGGWLGGGIIPLCLCSWAGVTAA